MKAMLECAQLHNTAAQTAMQTQTGETAVCPSSGRSSRLLLSNSLRDEVLREEPAPISMKPS